MASHALAEAPSLPGARAAARLAVKVPSAAPGRGPTPDLLPSERVLPVIPELARLFPGGGLPRGGTVLLGPATMGATSGSVVEAPGTPVAADPAPGSTSLLLSLLAGASSRGYWCAVVGLPALGFVAAAELGADLGRLVLVPRPGSEGRWQSVVAILLETVDLVCLAPSAPVRPGDARKLAARARERRSTLLVFDGANTPTGAARGPVPGGQVRQHRVVTCWPGPSDLRCAVKTSSWSGLGLGHGLLSSRQLEAEVGGRGAASRPRRGLLRFPA